MIPTLFFYELVLVALVWLFLMLYWLWPNDSVMLCSTLPTLPPPQRKRSREPRAFAGLSQKPPCTACEQDATHPRPPPLSAVGFFESGHDTHVFTRMPVPVAPAACDLKRPGAAPAPAGMVSAAPAPAPR